MDNETFDWVVELTALAQESGPFFFVVFFGLFFLRWTNKQFRDAGKRSAPKDEMDTYRGVHIGSCIVFVLLLGFTSWLWAKEAGKPNVFKFSIVDVSQADSVYSENLNLYTKVIQQQKPSPDVLGRKTIHFAAISKEPFEDGKKFNLGFWKGTRKRQSLWVLYTEQSEPQYKIKYLRDKDRYELIAEQLATLVPFPLVTRTWAGTKMSGGKKRTVPEDEVPAPESISRDQIIEQLCGLEDTRASIGCRFRILETISPGYGEKKDLDTDAVVSLLQSERSLVNSKLAALNQLLNLTADDLNEFFMAPHDGENLILTLLDLSRHTDAEIAAKSQGILDKIGYNQFVARMLVSDDPKTRSAGENILLRVEKEKALGIVDEVEKIPLSGKRTAFLKALVASDKAGRALVPTGSAQGDRYYVMANWKIEDQATRKCLTELFHKALITDRSLVEERNFMKDRIDRWFYWYSKTWALNIADQVKECGAKAYFVGF